MGSGRRFGILSFIMKIIFLNTWGAKMKDAMSAFLEGQSLSTDIFCFQEAYEATKVLARETLKDYTEVAVQKSMGPDENFFQATYIKKGISLLSSETVLEDEPDAGVELYTHVRFNDKDYHIGNAYGAWKPINKLDDPTRLRQSQKIIEFFKDKKGPKIIGGDFNLFPETKSIQMFEENGYRNLIKEFKITTTRNRLAWEMYPDNKQDYADYAFVSTEVTVKSFSVPDLEISDHLPLILEIE